MPRTWIDESLFHWKGIRSVHWNDKLFDQVKHFLLTGEVPKELLVDRKKASRWRVKYRIYSMSGEDIALVLNEIPNWCKSESGEVLFECKLPMKLIVVQEKEKTKLMETLFKHPSFNGHRGVRSFHERLSRNFLGVFREDVEKFMRNNEITQMSQPTEVKIIKPILSTKPFHIFECDLVDMSQYEKQNKKVHFLLNVIDHFSKFAFSRPLKSKHAVLVAAEMQGIFLSYGAPNVLLCDNGSEFISMEFKTLCSRFGVELRHGKPYTPNTQGAIEKFNDTLKSSIRKHMTQNENSKYLEALQSLVFQYNCQRHSTTKFTPFQVLFKRDQSINPIDVIVKKNIEEKANKMVEKAILNSKGVKDEIKIGDRVRIDNRAFKNTRRLNLAFGKKSKLTWSKDIYTVVNIKSDKENEKLKLYSVIDSDDDVLAEDGKVIWLYRHFLMRLDGVRDAEGGKGEEKREKKEDAAGGKNEESEEESEEEKGSEESSSSSDSEEESDREHLRVAMDKKREGKLALSVHEEHLLMLSEKAQKIAKVDQKDLQKKDDEKEAKELKAALQEESKRTGVVRIPVPVRVSARAGKGKNKKYDGYGR